MGASGLGGDCLAIDIGTTFNLNAQKWCELEGRRYFSDSDSVRLHHGEYHFRGA